MTLIQHRYPNQHITYARSLRRTMTDAERKLWNVLRQRIMGGLKWRRQQPVGPYIVDFYCSAKRLIIEIDGGQHCGSEADLVRDAWLKQRSFSVLRFWNNEILDSLDAVLTVILERQSLIEPAPLSFRSQKARAPAAPPPGAKNAPGGSASRSE